MDQPDGLSVSEDAKVSKKTRKKTVIDAFISGSLSSTFTTIIYQPLEVLKTRIQIQGNQKPDGSIMGRTRRLAVNVVGNHGVRSLWRGTGVSLIRSIPGVGLYYASLDALQNRISMHDNTPDSPIQAFCFGWTARSFVSFIMLPVTVLKVRYESGQYRYDNLLNAVKHSYLNNGWVGVIPTISRDSLFSATYFMLYTQFKSYNIIVDRSTIAIIKSHDLEAQSINHLKNFSAGILSGLVASIVSNPIDVLKTLKQVNASSDVNSLKSIVMKIFRERNGYMRFFDGLVPRVLRRTLMSATTWTAYEIMMDIKR